MSNDDHPTCDDPTCAICNERERVAILDLKAAARSPAMQKIKTLVDARQKRPQA